MACVHTINVPFHSTVDGVPENSIQGRAQAVTAIEIKRSVHLNRNLFDKRTIIQSVLLP